MSDRMTTSGEPSSDNEPREHLLRDADSPDDWAWRRHIRSRRPLLLIYRGVILTVGLGLIGLGLVLVPLPGPGWVIVFLGLALLASEFEPANRLLKFGRKWLHQWNLWMRRQTRTVQALVALATFAFVCAVLWVTMYISGVPAWLPDPIEQGLVDWAGLPRA